MELEDRPHRDRRAVVNALSALLRIDVRSGGRAARARSVSRRGFWRGLSRAAPKNYSAGPPGFSRGGQHKEGNVLGGNYSRTRARRGQGDREQVRTAFRGDPPP